MAAPAYAMPDMSHYRDPCTLLELLYAFPDMLRIGVSGIHVI